MLQKPRFKSLLASLGVLAASSGIAAAAEEPDLQTLLQPPAPEGTTPLKVETLAEGLVNPWSIAFLPDGALLVTEREGRLRVIRDGKLQDKPVAGTPEPYVQSQAGFFDVVLDPGFETNGALYLSYAAGTAKENATRVVAAHFDGTSLSDIRTVYETRWKKPTPVHYGGRMAFMKDGTLLITVGDGFDFREKAQDLSSDLGKIVRVNTDGSFPADNPFANRKDALPEIWTYGHRNEQGLVIAADGTVIETEHGARGGDEINIIEPGKNYGWPLATYGIDYSGAKVTPYTEYEGTEQPIKYWTPSIAPSGLAIYDGDLFPGWKGDLLVGALAERSLHRIKMKNGKPVGEERYLVGERVRDVRVGPDGAIYVTTEERHGDPVGAVLRLTPQK